MDIGLKILLAFVLGAVIGLEREINERKAIIGDKSKKKSAILGLRSFSLIAGLGTLSGLLFTQFSLITGILAAGFVVLMIAFYILESTHTLDFGITTELALFFTFTIGFLLAVELLPIQTIIALTVVLVLLMSRKENIKNMVEDIHKNEMNAAVSFAILAFVILPFLPNQDYSIGSSNGLENFFRNVGININRFADIELFNPFKLWFIVVLITGVDLLGYILERTIGGKRGWLLTSIVGGFVSSTATTISLAQESKSGKNVQSLLSGAIFANAVSFLPVIVLLGTLNPQLLIGFLPVLFATMAASFFIGLYFLRSAKEKEKKVATQKKIEEKHKIFDLVAALKFVGIFLVINIVSKITLEFFGNTGFLITTGLGALTGIDAVVINTAQLVGSRIDIGLGVWALILANSVNLLAKSVYSYLQGSTSFALQFFMSMVAIIGISVVTALFFLFI